MASMSMLMKVFYVVALLVVLLAPVAEVEAVTCGQVSAAISPCLGYLRNGGNPTTVCCNGMRGLRNQATTTGARKDICNCVKNSASSYRGVNGFYAASLLGRCGINLPYKIRPSTDCNRIQ